MKLARSTGRMIANMGALAALIATNFGCALAVGIEEVSGTQIDAWADACIKQINMRRISKGVIPMRRWIDAESCATDAAKTYRESSSFGADCGDTAGAACGNYPGPPEDMIADCIVSSPADDDRYGEVACGFYVENDKVWAVLLFR